MPLLVFKLFVLFVAAFFSWQLGRMVVRAVWSVAEPVLAFAWRIVTAPVRLPWRAIKRLYRPIERRRWERQRRREQLQEAERVRASQLLNASDRQRQLDDIKRALEDL